MSGKKKVAKPTARSTRGNNKSTLKTKGNIPKVNRTFYFFFFLKDVQFLHFLSTLLQIWQRIG